MSTQPKPLRSIGIREFREHAAEYLGGAEPIAVTRHGRVIGLYFPVPPDQAETKRAIERLGESIDRIRAGGGMSEDELSDWFNLRKPLPD